MAKDPRKNSLVNVVARKNKLEGTVDVLQDRPELISDGSGSFIVYDNNKAMYNVLTAHPRGDVNKEGVVENSNEPLVFKIYKKGLSAANGKFGSPFPPIEYNLLETFGEASNLENPGQSGSLVFLDGKGRFADNAINYKKRFIIEELNFKWSGIDIESAIPFITASSVAYQLTSNDYKKRWSPNAPRQFQSGNIWFRPPVQNLWDSEVIWKLTSGSNFETGNRVGRALVSGTVGSSNALTPIENPYIYTTGSTVEDFGSDTSENRFLEGGAIRDNSTSVTLGHHFRPNNFLTRQKAASALIFDIRNEENSGRLTLGQQFRTISRYQLLQLSSSADIFGDIDFSLTESLTRPSEKTSNFYRSSDLYVSDLVYQSGSLVKSFSRETGVPVDKFQYTQSDTALFSLEKEGLLRTFDIGDSPTTSADLIDCSLSPLFDVLLYDFSILTGKIKEELPFFPDKIYLGDPVRIYFGDIAGGLNSIRVKTFNIFKEIVLLTSQGQVFLKRDLGFSDSDFETKSHIDLSDPRIYFNSEFGGRGFFNRQNPLVLDPALRVEIVGILGLYEKDSLLNSFGNIVGDRSYRQIGLQYYKIPRKYYTYFNSNGHVAHHLDNEPYSYIRGGSVASPSRDPGFDDVGLESLGYRKTDDIIPAIQDADNDSSFYFRLYNSQLGEPFIRNFNPKNITNFVSKFNYNFNIRSSGNYNFRDSSQIDFSRNDRTPLVPQALPSGFKAFITNAQESVDINTAGFIGSGEAPILPYDTSNENAISDALGNLQVRNIKSDYFPIFDKNGDINSFIGSDIFVNIKNREENEEQNSREIALSLLRVTKEYPNFVFNMNDNGKLGFFSYNPERDIGVGYDLYLGSSPAFCSGSIYQATTGSLTITNVFDANSSFPKIFLNRYGSQQGLNRFYWLRANNILGGSITNPDLQSMTNCLTVNGDNFFSSSTDKTKYIGSLVTANRQIAGSDRVVFSDFDPGILSATIRNPTKNFLNPKNSDAFIYVDSEGKQRNGIFVAPKSNSSSSSFYTGSVKYSYLYDGITPNSTWTHTPQGFTQVSFSTEFLPNNVNNLLRPGNQFSFKRRPGQNNTNYSARLFTDPEDDIRLTFNKNSMAYACYCISDGGEAYANTFDQTSLYEIEPLVTYNKPANKSGYIDFPASAFLNFPMVFNQDINALGIQSVSQSVAYRNMHNYISASINDSAEARFLTNYSEDKYFIHPKSISYAISPKDNFFGTAFLQQDSQNRQITKNLSFYLENSVWQDLFDYTDDTFDSGAYRNRNFRSENISDSNKSPCLYGLPAGSYTFVFNLQDMIMPVNSELWSRFGEGQKPNLFTPENRLGEDNGLRSNFYFNIPECNVNKTFFNIGTVSEIRNSTSITVTGQSRALTGPDAISVGVAYSSLTTGSANVTIKISDASDFSYQTVTGSGQVDQYKGVFLPDPSNINLGVDGLNIEGSNTEVLPNGQIAQSIKKIRIDIFCDKTIVLDSFREIASLAVSFRPNSQLLDSQLSPIENENTSEIDSYSYYQGYDYEDHFKMNKGEVLCFARMSSFGTYTSLYGANASQDASSRLSVPSFITELPYDSFAHISGSRPIGFGSNSFLNYKLDTINTIANQAITHRTVLGYHSLLSHGDSCAEFEIGSLTGSNFIGVSSDNPYIESNNANFINRSIIDQGNSLNIIQFAGIAVAREN